MKKLIAIAVVFALVMGGVFAETTVSGSASGKVLLGQGGLYPIKFTRLSDFP